MPGVDLQVRNLRPDDWNHVKALFGTKGACGGCWCMHFRVPRGGKFWEEVKGDKNRRAMKRLIERGEQPGCLAFAGDEAVGWVSVGPRASYQRMDNSRVFRTPFDENAWSVPCFFIRRDWQRRGVSRLLLRQAVALARESGASHLLGYPVTPKKGREIPTVFAHNGLAQTFERERFRDVTPEGGTHLIYMRRFRGGSR